MYRHGCKLSDHSLEAFDEESLSGEEAAALFASALRGLSLIHISMCIRDRGSSVYLPVALFACGVLMIIGPVIANMRGKSHESRVGYMTNHGLWLAPVSYTQLDVYKRQPYSAAAS